MPGAGRKPRPASSPLIRNSIECPRGAGSSVMQELLAVGDAELLAHQVDPAGLLRDRVLHLQSGVHLEERDGAVRPDQELDRAGAVVPGLEADRSGRRVDLAALVVGEERCRRLLDQLLVPPLQRAVAGADDDHGAVRVGQHLGLDVPRPVQVPLDEALAAAERGHRLADRRLEQLGDLLERAGHLQPATTTAERGLDGHRQPVLPGEGDHLVRTADRFGGTGNQRSPDPLGDVPGGDLVAEVADRLRGRPDPGQPGIQHGLGEVGVLGEESVAGVHGVGAGPARRRRAAWSMSR